MSDHGICPECYEHCEFVEETEEPDPGPANRPMNERELVALDAVLAYLSPDEARHYDSYEIGDPALDNHIYKEIQYLERFIAEVYGRHK